jgi:hypothetical protein
MNCIGEDINGATERSWREFEFKNFVVALNRMCAANRRTVPFRVTDD